MIIRAGAVVDGVKTCDLLIIGGGLAGASLGRVMALAGHDVIILEKEAAFRDRVRGEVLLPWGSHEAQLLGIYDLLLERCAREFLREHFFLGGNASEPRDYRSTTPKQTCGLSFFHPDMQATLLASAEDAGVEVRRCAVATTIRPGPVPEVDFIWKGESHTVSAKLIVGADGRDSRAAGLLGLAHERDEPELFTGGLQLKGELEIEHALYFSLHEAGGRGSILVSNHPGNFRAYLLHHKDALPRLLSGQRDFIEVKRHFAEIGWPKDWLDALEPHGTFATFDGAHRWIAGSLPENCVLVGDAFGVSDPVWGNGLSRSLRDVRLLSERLLETDDWRAAARHFVEDHNDFFHRLRRVERLNAKLHFAIGSEAGARRKRAYNLMAERPELSPDVTGNGPDIVGLDDMERLLLNC
jgi:2-polyprenyl-6-methoxyphenol hydroxylase-like FAD-dependent oxidoreductase